MGQPNPTERIQTGRRLTYSSVQTANSEIHQGHLVLINPEHPIRQTISSDRLLPLSSIPTIHTLHDGMLLDKTCLRNLAILLEACQGMNEIIAVSGYRTKLEQEKIYESSLADNGAEYTARYVALPDRSEHQTGLAIDVGKRNKDVDFIAPAFPDSGVYKRFKQLAARHGFIQRYKEGKESITRISCEPWHFRYVGYPHAEIMEQNDWCLEEYIDRLESRTFENDHLVFENERSFTEIYYVAAEAGTSTAIPLIECDRYYLSGNNRDGFIVTAVLVKGSRTHV
ncbi:D-alanyl-D-alanine carboxypeptidase family protein [Cohnella thailandensis]|uniref:D-alanyl-D-alanine carboxypeptidase family protein n=1 Tax=Cohnella thailandensis TaxID=557557 RepID=A0A841SVU1_9BACL|nr:D-alanyl-D-alanine carboxypeptidase family protein [Cohnella thailandensis]MBB6634205.1 D-alanyl-D-alanine carboxypeptidase family protein [Cohnella thailandensis]MBP1972297.1 D-alanyl-D-alanine dipeptidase/carboxypeptidase [Cohnella thailandensis]